MGRPSKIETALRERVAELEEAMNAQRNACAQYRGAGRAMEGGLLLAKEFLRYKAAQEGCGRWDKFILVSLENWFDGALKSGHDRGLLS